MPEPKVSIIMPSLNVKDYIRESLKSVISQTLNDIEIICVDSGSTDGTLDILREYAGTDSRIKLLISDKKSYGQQMNMGIDAASGEYIGIVETDDYVRPEMYEILYNMAKEKNVDFIKSDFYRFVRKNGEEKLRYCKLSTDKNVYGKVLNPQDDVSLFNLVMNTWSGIYNRAFLSQHHIRHNETPGASYQDNGFWFQTFAWARRVYFLDIPFYMNRRDNQSSSVHSRSKIYCMNDEYDYIWDFLNENTDLKKHLLPQYCKNKYDSYLFTYNRIGQEHKLEYIIRFSDEFREHYEDGHLQKEIFGAYRWANLRVIINDPLGYYLYTSAYIKKQAFFPRIVYKVAITPMKIMGALRYLQEHGIISTAGKCLEKIRIS